MKSKNNFPVGAPPSVLHGITTKFNSLKNSNGKVVTNATNAYKLVAAESEAMSYISNALSSMKAIIEKYDG